MFLYKERDETFFYRVSQIHKSVYYPTNVDNLIRLIVCSISLLTCFIQRQDSDIRANDNALFPAIAGRAGRTTRLRDKWITTYYAYRTEINSVTIVVERREEERERRGMDGKKVEKKIHLLIPMASLTAKTWRKHSRKCH